MFSHFYKISTPDPTVRNSLPLMSNRIPQFSGMQYILCGLVFSNSVELYLVSGQRHDTEAPFS